MLCRSWVFAGTLWPTAPRVRVEDSPSPVYGAALLMRLGVTTLRGSNPRSSACFLSSGFAPTWRRPPGRHREPAGGVWHRHHRRVVRDWLEPDRTRAHSTRKWAVRTGWWRSARAVGTGLRRHLFGRRSGGRRLCRGLLRRRCRRERDHRRVAGHRRLAGSGASHRPNALATGRHGGPHPDLKSTGLSGRLGRPVFPMI
jgi:hypothetical protein